MFVQIFATVARGCNDFVVKLCFEVSKGCWQRYRQIAKGAPALLIRGRLEKEEGVINIVADKLEPLPIGAAPASRDFR